MNRNYRYHIKIKSVGVGTENYPEDYFEEQKGEIRPSDELINLLKHEATRRVNKVAPVELTLTIKQRDILEAMVDEGTFKGFFNKLKYKLIRA